jgi:hypothetical protein
MALTVSCCTSGDYDPWHAGLKRSANLGRDDLIGANGKPEVFRSPGGQSRPAETARFTSRSEQDAITSPVLRSNPLTRAGDGIRTHDLMLGNS